MIREHNNAESISTVLTRYGISQGALIVFNYLVGAIDAKRGAMMSYPAEMGNAGGYAQDINKDFANYRAGQDSYFGACYQNDPRSAMEALLFINSIAVDIKPYRNGSRSVENYLGDSLPVLGAIVGTLVFGHEKGDLDLHDLKSAYHQFLHGTTIHNTSSTMGSYPDLPMKFHNMSATAIAAMTLQSISGTLEYAGVPDRFADPFYMEVFLPFGMDLWQTGGVDDPITPRITPATVETVNSSKESSYDYPHHFVSGSNINGYFIEGVIAFNQMMGKGDPKEWVTQLLEMMKADAEVVAHFEYKYLTPGVTVVDHDPHTTVGHFRI